MAFHAANGQVHPKQEHLIEASWNADCYSGPAGSSSMMDEQFCTPEWNYRMISGYHFQSDFDPFRVRQDALSQTSSSVSATSQSDQEAKSFDCLDSHAMMLPKQSVGAALLAPAPANTAEASGQRHIASRPLSLPSESKPSPESRSPKQSTSLTRPHETHPQLRPPPRARAHHQPSTAPSVRSIASTPSETERTLAKKAHSAVERKYRQNLNSRIAELQAVLLATGRLGRSRAGSARSVATATGTAVTPRKKMGVGQGTAKASKSEVLRNAVRYVEVMETLVGELEVEIREWKGRAGLGRGLRM
jgi:hypothetical protein